MLGKKSINKTDILKITNLSENYNISELVDSCLSKNKNKITKILNENNFSSDDCVLIIRTYLSKLKRLLNIYERLEIDNSSIENVLPFQNHASYNNLQCSSKVDHNRSKL